MKKLKVRNARRLITERPITVTPEETLEELVLAITEDPKTRAIFVVDRERRLKGIIGLKDLVRATFTSLANLDSLGHSAVRISLSHRASDMSYGTMVYVKDDDSLDSALTKMLDNGLEEIPVVDDDMKVIGELDLRELLMVWLEKAIKREIVG